jgi:hypothetical protein
VRLDDLLVDLARGDLQAAGPVSLALAELEDGLLSHLAYEESELLGPIARLGIRV